ncbi:hypothetical protein BDW71DRAFT_212142 [Aspergillus fruticulosus]
MTTDEYTIGWICALPIEKAAARAMLDEIHDTPPAIPRSASDKNSYTLGRIGSHNIIVASLSSGVYGETPAATVAAQMLVSFQGGNDTGSEFTFEELLDEEMVVIERDFANLDDRHPCWLEVWNIDSSSTRSKLFLQFRRGFPSKYRESAFAVNPTGTRVPFAFAPVGDAERDAGPREAVAVEEWDIINSEILCTDTL